MAGLRPGEGLVTSAGKMSHGRKNERLILSGARRQTAARSAASESLVICVTRENPWTKTLRLSVSAAGYMDYTDWNQ